MRGKLIRDLTIGTTAAASATSTLPNAQLRMRLLSRWRRRGKERTLTYLYTVEPVYNGPVFSGHPLLSGQFSKSRFFAHTNAVFVTCITRPPLLSGRGPSVAV